MPAYSLNEIESLCRKAARGAGLSWGLAQEAGYTARWLAAQQLPGPMLLANLLVSQQGICYAQRRPRIDGDVWQAQGHTLCPLISGAALVDRATLLQTGNRLTLHNVGYPLLLLPAAASIAQHIATPVVLSWQGISLGVDVQQGLAKQGPMAQLSATVVDTVLVNTSDLATDVNPPYPGPHKMAGSTLHQLEALAWRTYAPSSEHSRHRDAGA